MKTLSHPTRRRSAGWSLVEMMISMTVLTVVTGGALSGMVSLQRTFSATVGYSSHLGDELRIADYIARDLRQASSVVKTGTGSSTVLSLKIPNYYDATGKPVDPLIDSKTGGAYYQDAAGNRTVPVVFYITNDVMYRNLNGLPTAIATNVKDFDIFPIDSATDPNASTDFNFTGISGKVAEVKLQIRFKTNFSEQFATGGVNSSTALYNTTLLRNVRTDAATGLY